MRISDWSSDVCSSDLDLAFGLHTVAKHYYYPGWQEPGPTVECMINKTAFAALPADLQRLIGACCRAANEAMLAEFTARNQDALDTLIREHGVDEIGRASGRERVCQSV